MSDFFFPFQSLIEQIEQRAEKIPEWVLVFHQSKRACALLFYLFI